MAATANLGPPPPPQRLIGYARLSPDNQFNDTQIDELRAAGCDRIYQEQGSGAPGARPVLAKLLKDLADGDVLLVVSLDRLAHSISHLLGVLEDLENRRVYFRSLHDPIDTTTPHGGLSLRVLAAVVRLERTLIVERTQSGMKIAKAQGRLAGNPGLRERRPEAIQAVSVARRRAYLDELISSAQTWLPTVRQLRPRHSWDDVVGILNRRGQDWTVERLRRAVHRMVDENLAEAELLSRSPRRPPEHDLMRLVAGIAIADPSRSLRDIGAELDRMQERPPRGGRKWQASTVRALLDEARRFGLIRDRGPGP